jgi:putative ABC transport system permease protein
VRRSLLSSLRAHLGRLVAACLAIVLGVAFGTVTLTAWSTASHVVDSAIGADYKGVDVVLAPRTDSITPQEVAAVRRTPGVREVQTITSAYLQTVWAGDRRPSVLEVRATNDAPDLPFTRPTQGRMPSSATEIALPETLASKHKIAVGNQLQVKTVEGKAIPLTVVGLVADHGTFDHAPAIADRAAVRTWADAERYDEVRIAAQDGTPPAVLADALRKAVGKNMQVATGTEWTDKRVKLVTGGIDVLAGVFGMFAVIAVFVAGLVIANIFTILIAQRTREMALLRCVGASRRQIFGSVLAEAAAVGVVASAAGVLAGLGLTAAGLGLALRFDWGIPDVGIHPNTSALLAPFLVGAIATVLAGIVPARRATRVAPLAALRPVNAAPATSRAGMLRIVLGAVMLGGGGLLLADGASAHKVLVGVAGGLLSFFGVLVVGAVLVPALVRLAGALPARGGGVPGRLAVANAVRNPRRTAATTSALLIGVTLISLTCVGIASMKRTFDLAMDENYPVDLMISGQTGGLPDTVLQQVRALPGIAAAVPVRQGTVSLGEVRTVAQGIDPVVAGSVIHAATTRLRPGVAFGSPMTFRDLQIHDGQLVTLQNGGHTVKVRMVALESLDSLLLAASDLRTLDPRAPVSAVWADAAADADGEQVLHDVNQAVTGVDELSVGGGLAERTNFTKVFDVLLVVAIALLAVSVLIALVGVGNTLSLSALERTRENALLRSLGLTRRQLRAMLAAESVLMALVAAGLGIALGLVYGWSGTAALMGGQADRLAYALPVGQLLTVALVAAAAGLLASILPARRAARVAPAAALADE